MKRTMLALLAAWLLGIATALGGVAVTGGWYEYHFVGVGAPVTDQSSPAALSVEAAIRKTQIEMLTNSGGWQPVPNVNTAQGTYWLMRPRIRLGW